MNCKGSRSERVASILIESLLGKYPKLHRERNIIDHLKGRIETWVVPRPQEAARWALIQSDPRRSHEQLARLVAELAKSDAVAQQLMTTLAPVEEGPLRAIQFQDFIVSIECPSSPASPPQARLVETPVGYPCKEPLDVGSALGPDLSVLVRQLERVVLSTRGVKRVGEAMELTVDLKALGRGLFDAVFRGGIREAWFAATGQLHERPDRGVRLVLIFDLRSPDLQPLAALPWEILVDPWKGQSICLNVQTPLVRSIEIAAGSAPSNYERQGLLLLRSNPAGHELLHTTSEGLSIEESWQAVPGIRIERSVADIHSLYDLLQSGLFGILHFMGHGGFDSRSGGYLLFENRGGRSVKIPAETLVHQLARRPLQLVVLSTCRGGELPRRAGVDPFGSIAAALLRAGVPNVVAMQFAISDDVALAFSRELYCRLSRGASIEVAVTEGRLAIDREFPGSLEWVTPVLYRH